jgi:hypothetical protein
MSLYCYELNLKNKAATVVVLFLLQARVLSTAGVHINHENLKSVSFQI